MGKDQAALNCCRESSWCGRRNREGTWECEGKIFSPSRERRRWDKPAFFNSSSRIPRRAKKVLDEAKFPYQETIAEEYELNQTSPVHWRNF